MLDLEALVERTTNNGVDTAEMVKALVDENRKLRDALRDARELAKKTLDIAEGAIAEGATHDADEKHDPRHLPRPPEFYDEQQR